MLFSICAWCGTALHDEPAGIADHYTITHGICEECRLQLFMDNPKAYDQFLDSLNAPILAVNREGEVMGASGEACGFLQVDHPDRMRELPGGEVMQCIYADEPGGCGNTIHCKACTIRNNVTYTLETGNSLHEVPAFLYMDNGEGRQKTEFLISTELMDPFVLLRIDKVFPSLVDKVPV
ncbi:hypothetical protein GF324_12965 [bacterium]|nr:hypothetical protein [bacterium]